MFSYLLFFFLSLGQIGRISFSNQEINIYLYEVIVGAWFLFLFFKHKFSPIEKSLKTVFHLYLFFGWLYATFVLSLWRFTIQQNAIALLYLGRLSLYFLFFLYLNFDKKFKKNLFKRGLLLYSIFTIIFSIAQYFLYPNLRNLQYLGWDPHQYRIFGTLFDTSAQAAIVGLLILFFLFERKIIPNMTRYALLLSSVVTGLLTYSRGFYISFLSTLAVFFVKTKQFFLLGGILVIFAMGVFALPKPFGEGVNLQRTFSLESRLRDNREAVDIFNKSPLFGIGYNHIRAVKSNDQQSLESHAGASFHSSFLIILVTSGAVGLVLFLMLLWRLAMTGKTGKYYILFLSLFSLFDNILLYPTVLLLLLLILSNSSERKIIFRT